MTMSKPKVLLIGGSLNQTTIVHQIAQQLPECDCYFTPFYADGLIGWLTRLGLTRFTILGGRHRQATERYLRNHNLAVDYRGQQKAYDLVVTCTDLLLPHNILNTRLVLVQEGMLEAEDWRFHLVRTLKLPRYLANTAATGLSHAYHAFCVASPGYRDLFIRKGVHPDKIVVTGIPNFDNAVDYLNNDFPHRGYVLVATSATRETLKFHDRERFLQRIKVLANGRPIIFKLHPNENIERATREIRRYFPCAPIYAEGNLHHMIANSEMLIAQNTSAIFTALVLGKPIHCDLDLATLKRLLPIQNGGRSAERIAEVCRQLLQTPLTELNRRPLRSRPLPRWEVQDLSS